MNWNKNSPFSVADVSRLIDRSTKYYLSSIIVLSQNWPWQLVKNVIPARFLFFSKKEKIYFRMEVWKRNKLVLMCKWCRSVGFVLYCFKISFYFFHEKED